MPHILCDISSPLLIKKFTEKNFNPIIQKVFFSFNKKKIINFVIEKYNQSAYMYRNIVLTESKINCQHLAICHKTYVLVITFN